MLANQTNATITITRRDTTWDKHSTETSLGTFKVWVEERAIVKTRAAAKNLPADRKYEESGIIFLFTDLDLQNCFITYSGAVHEIISTERFTTPRGLFHHLEVAYA